MSIEIQLSTMFFRYADNNTSVEVNGNTIHDNQSYGIYLRSNSTRWTRSQFRVRDNTIYANGVGIYSYTDYSTMQVEITGNEVRDNAITYLTQNLDRETAMANDLVILNTLSWQRGALSRTKRHKEAGAIRVAGGEALPVQHYAGHTWFRAPALPSLGWTVAAFDDEAPASEMGETAIFLDNVIETPLYQIELDDNGNLARIFDKRSDREVLSAPAT